MRQYNFEIYDKDRFTRASINAPSREAAIKVAQIMYSESDYVLKSSQPCCSGNRPLIQETYHYSPFDKHV